MAGTKPGRGELLTARTLKNLVEGIRLGLRYGDAAVRAGISARTFYRWKARGEAALDDVYEVTGTDDTFMPDPIELEWDAIEQLIPAGERRFARLALQVAEANVHAKANAVAEVLRAFAPTRNGDGDIVEKGDWKAAAWFLERRFPDEFGRTDKAYVEHTGAVASVAIDPADVGTVSKVLEAFREANVGIPAGDTEEEES